MVRCFQLYFNGRERWSKLNLKMPSKVEVKNGVNQTFHNYIVTFRTVEETSEIGSKLSNTTQNQYRLRKHYFTKKGI
jgi:hypothetical protein